MFVTRLQVLLQTLSLLTFSSFVVIAFATAPQRTNRNTYRRQQHPCHIINSKHIMCPSRPVSSLMAFNHKQQRQQQPNVNSNQKYRQKHQQQYRQSSYHVNLPLAMVPEQHKEQGRNNTRSTSRPATSLDATTRGGGDGSSSETDSLIELNPKRTSTTTNQESSFLSQLSTIAEPATDTISSITKGIVSSKKAQGRVILLLVAFLYGTLNVTLRAIYATSGAPVASVLSLVRQLLSVLAFVPILIASNKENAKREEEESGKYWEELDQRSEDGVIGEKTRPMWIAALELSFWNFGAQGLINAGLLYSPAARASFLTQTSVVMTPLISALAGESIKSSVWGGCALALVGLFLISTSSSASDVSVGDAVSSFNQGDAMILLGALSWSTYIFRTSKMASNYSELDLQYTKTVLLAVMYGGWFVTNVVSTLSSAGTSFLSAGWLEALTPLWSGWMNPIVWILLTYSAVGPGAVADLLQQKGQKETSASESNIILCLESVFAAVCAFLLLGEVSSMREIFGGSMIVLAAVLASK
mmetsp:Transcript_39/g.97  ORF Transcript_39/g.97 Transcript_39/m.97 type:complete len:529 (+) Transcript_39:140-1726(+)